MNCFILFFSIISASSPSPESQSILKLRAQDVIDLVLKNSDEFKNVELQAREAEVRRLRRSGIYDTELTAEGSYERSRIDTISGTQNIEDRNIRYKLGVEQSVPTGARLELSYERLHQDSKLRNSNAGLRDPNQVYDGVFLTLRQDILRNALGIAERALNTSSKLGVTRSDLQKKEDVEALLLSTLNLFWVTYVAKEDLRYAILGRDRFEKLVNSLASKVKRELAERSDFSRATAEFENKQREVKSLSLVYLNLLEDLARILKLGTNTIELEVANILPPPPEPSKEEYLQTRPIQVAQLSLQQSELEKKATRWSTLPSVELFGTAGFTGVAKGGSDSFSKVVGADRPVYEVGIALSLSPFSKQKQAEDLAAEVAYLRSVNNLSLAKATALAQQEISFRNLQSKYVIAQSALKTFEAREMVIKDQENRYRRGLISLADLIQDYNFYYSSQSARSQALADYYLATMEWEATRDILVK